MNTEELKFFKKYLDVIYSQQLEQTKILKSINTAVTFMAVVTLLGLAAGFCIGFLGL